MPGATRVSVPSTRAIARRRSRAALTGAALLLALAACTSGRALGGHGASGSPASGGDDTPTSTASSSSAPAAPAAVITNSASGHVISPAKPVTISVANGTLTSVVMKNPAGKMVSGAIATDGSSWKNTEALGYGRTYSVTATATNADGKNTVERTSVTTVTPNNLTQPYIDDVYGASIKNGGTYGIGMIVNLVFDEQITNRAAAERALTVTTTPHVNGSWYWADNSHVHWRPQTFYQPGTKVTVSAKVYGINVGDGLYGQSDQTVSFTIGQKHVSIANAKTHHVKVYTNGTLVRSMPTSMGRGGYVTGNHGQQIPLWTMQGTYTVLGFENPAIMSSDSYGLPANSPAGYAPEKVYWSTKISTDGIYLHELDATVWAQGNTNVSHGCLNLNYTNAKWFFKYSQVGDVVEVVDPTAPKIQEWQGGDWSVSWADWKKGSALA